MACPYFFPTKRCDAELWPHPARLPLGGSWRGQCTAPGCDGVPSEQQLKDGCNLGYARCGRLPEERTADAVRFAIAGEESGCVRVRYVFEIGHRPGEHGILQFDCAARQWVAPHPDRRVQRMAECFLAAARQRRSAS